MKRVKETNATTDAEKNAVGVWAERASPLRCAANAEAKGRAKADAEAAAEAKANELTSAKLQADKCTRYLAGSSSSA